MDPFIKKVNVTVFGATGKVGSELIKFLSAQSIPNTAVTRDLKKAAGLPFTTWQEGELDNTCVVKRALEGADALFLNTGVQQNMVDLQCRIIDEAKQFGITHIIKLSTPAARPDSPDPVGGWHWQVEQYLAASGLRWHTLQPQSFMQNWLGDFAQTVKSEKKIYETAGEGRRAFTDTRDIAEVAVALFTDSGKWKEPIVPLSGPALVSYYQVAEAIGNAIGDEIRYIDQSPEDATERYRKKGTPEFMIKTYLAIAHNQKIGVGEKLLTDNVSRILNKPTRSIDDFARDYSAYFI